MTTKWKAAAYVVGGVSVVTWLSCMVRRRPASSERALGEQYLIEASKWSTIAGNEKNMILALMHVNYALSCANVAKALCDAEAIRAKYGMDISNFIAETSSMQASIVKSLGESAPSMKPDAELAQASGWI